jgi:class 3 adenylate cyclase
MWEAFTRLQPYDGMSPAAIAVSVLRNNFRPPIPEGYDLSALPSGLIEESSFSSNAYSAVPGASSTFNGRYMNSPEYDQDLKYLHLMTQCWHQDPVMRPSFLEIMTQLSTNDYGGGSKSGGSSSSSSSMASYADIRRVQARRGNNDTSLNSGDTLSSSASLNSGSIDGSGIHIPAFKYKVKFDDAGNIVGRYGTNEAMLSNDNVAAVFLDVTSAHVLWEKAPDAMVETMLLYNELVRVLAARHHGHETVIGDRGNSEGSMCLLFNEPEAACMMCFDLQKELLDLPWPKKLLSVPQAGEVVDPVTENVIFRGLRVRSGLHVGSISAKRSNDIRKVGVRHSGPAIDAAMKLASVAKPGQIVISATVRNRLIESGLVKKGRAGDDTIKAGDKQAKTIKTSFLRKLELPVSTPRTSASYTADETRAAEDRNRERRDSDLVDVKAFEMKVPGLYRFFEKEGGAEGESSEGDGSSSNVHAATKHGRGLIEADGDTWLNSANMCPWIIDYSKITVYEDKPLGSGSYGVVYRGKWQNVDIAVKRFIKQTMNERHTLEFRYDTDQCASIVP